MIYLNYGNIRDKILARSNEIVEKATRADSKSLFFRFSSDQFIQEGVTAKFEELIGGRSLFAEKFVVLCDGLSENAESSAFVIKRLNEISESATIFVFREGKMNKKDLDMFKKVSAKIEEFSTVEEKKGYAGAREVKLRAGYENFNIFHFTDALGSCDKKAAWVMFLKAERAGFPMEEIFWKAVWLYRNMILASSIDSRSGGDVIEKLKVSPFALSNSRKFLKNYTNEALLLKYKSLVDMYHRLRRGSLELNLAMEQFILNL